jgi:hypothetical protein
MLACTLKMNALKRSSVGSTIHTPARRAAGRRAERLEVPQERLDAEVVERAAEEDRRELPDRKALRPSPRPRRQQLDLAAQRLGGLVAQQLVQLGDRRCR